MVEAVLPFFILYLNIDNPHLFQYIFYYVSKLCKENVMALNTKKLDEKFSYADYCKWPEDERWELIDGTAYSMSPAPSVKHQILLGKLHLMLGKKLEGKKCQPYLSPFDVRLPDKGLNDEEVFTVVQPDLFILCDKSKLDRRGCIGAPDLVIEIISPSSVKRDRQLKLELYERHGVKEYWIVYPYTESIDVLRLDENGKYSKPQVYACDDTLEVPLLGGLQLELTKLFAENEEEEA